MAQAKTKKTKKKAAPKVAKFVYMGGFDQTKIWDGQTVQKGEAFTPKTDECKRLCAASPLFKKA